MPESTYPSRPFWVGEAAVSTAGFGLALAVAGWSVGFLQAEVVLFTFAFALSAGLGGPGKVLLVGAALGTLFAVGVALALGGPEDPDCYVLCSTMSSSEAFGLGIVLALLAYPGWALGAGAGALARSRRRSAS